jgi:hypothetical protein
MLTSLAALTNMLRMVASLADSATNILLRLDLLAAWLTWVPFEVRGH